MGKTNGGNILWAPWRMQYILKAQNKGCIFCKSLEQKKDGENFILYRGRKCFVILNIFPYNNGHLMVVPYKHTGDFEGLDEATLTELILVTKRMTKLLQKTCCPEGFNIGLNIGRCAGAGIVGHVHIHIVPRWQGDTNFMPILAKTKVVSESLPETYKKIKKMLRSEYGK